MPNIYLYNRVCLVKLNKFDINLPLQRVFKLDIAVFLLCLGIALAKVLHFGCRNFLGKNSFVICFRSHGTYGNNRMNRLCFHFKLEAPNTISDFIHLAGRHLKQMLHVGELYPAWDNNYFH